MPSFLNFSVLLLIFWVNRPKQPKQTELYEQADKGNTNFLGWDSAMPGRTRNIACRLVLEMRHLGYPDTTWKAFGPFRVNEIISTYRYHACRTLTMQSTWDMTACHDHRFFSFFITNKTNFRLKIFIESGTLIVRCKIAHTNFIGVCHTNSEVKISNITFHVTILLLYIWEVPYHVLLQYPCYIFNIYFTDSSIEIMEETKSIRVVCVDVWEKSGTLLVCRMQNLLGSRSLTCSMKPRGVAGLSGPRLVDRFSQPSAWYHSLHPLEKPA